MPLGNLALIVSDLDGTLLRTGTTEISERTRQAIAQWEYRGGIFIAATGRSPRTAIPIAQSIDLQDVIVCSNGAVTFDLTRQQITHHHPLPGETALELAQGLRAQYPEIGFGIERELEMEFEPNYARWRPQARGTVRVDIAALCAAPVTKLLAIHPDVAAPAICALAQELLGREIHATHSGLPYAEICAAGVSKASAIATICAERGIPSTAVAACGDMPNDLEMLRWAEISVAVANAHPDVLATATHRTTTNDEDGVARFIELALAAR